MINFSSWSARLKPWSEKSKTFSLLSESTLSNLRLIWRQWRRCNHFWNRNTESFFYRKWVWTLTFSVIVMFIWTENFDSQNRGNKSGEIIWKGSCPAAKPIYIMRDGEEYSAINSPLNVLRNRSFCSFCGIIFTQKTIHRWDNYCFIPN